jgi:hypothetical protein
MAGLMDRLQQLHDQHAGDFDEIQRDIIYRMTHHTYPFFYDRAILAGNEDLIGSSLGFFPPYTHRAIFLVPRRRGKTRCCAFAVATASLLVPEKKIVVICSDRRSARDVVLQIQQMLILLGHPDPRSVPEYIEHVTEEDENKSASYQVNEHIYIHAVGVDNVRYPIPIPDLLFFDDLRGISGELYLDITSPFDSLTPIVAFCSEFPEFVRHFRQLGIFKCALLSYLEE